LRKIPVGTVIGQKAPSGWSNIVIVATPMLTPDVEREAPRTASHYAQMFKFVVLADVGGTPGRYRLNNVARGFAVEIKGRDTIVDGDKTFGADLGMFGKRILTENEAHVDADVLQVVRGETFFVFDAQAVMRRGNDHVNMVMRHALVVVPETGKLGTFVWLLDKSGPEYKPAERAVQLLPDNMREPRYLSVKRDKFTLGIPTADAFALQRVPQGRPIAYTPELAAAASPRTITAAGAARLEAVLRETFRRTAP
jgi:hypothetical protein